MREILRKPIPLSKHRTLMRKYPKVLAVHLRKRMKEFGNFFLRELITRRLSKSGVQPPGGGLATRTGGLKRSFQMKLTGRTLKSMRLSVVSDSPYAAIHEYGGTIRPKKGRYLTIPLDAAKTAAGVARGGARMFDNTFVQKSRAGNLIIFQKKGDRIIPLFVLKESVRIPKRLGLRTLWRQLWGERQDFILKAVMDSWREVGVQT